MISLIIMISYVLVISSWCQRFVVIVVFPDHIYLLFYMWFYDYLCSCIIPWCYSFAVIVVFPDHIYLLLYMRF